MRIDRFMRPRLFLVGLALLSLKAHPVELSATSIGGTTTGSGYQSAPFNRARIEAFTDRRNPLSKAAGVKVYFVDEEEQLDAELSVGLPGDPAQAEVIARQRISQNKELIKQRIVRFAEGINKANRYAIERVPAIVFDGKTVVYGITDVEQAVAEFIKAGGKP